MIIIMILLIPLLRARFLSRNPKVEGPRFETRFGKIILFSDFPVCRGRPHESVEGEAALVLMRLSIELLYNEFLVSQPLFQWLDNQSIVTFYSADGGVRAKQRDVEITQKGDNFLGLKPGPFLIS